MIVGLTGGIGSGKTTVARIFERLKVPVYEADQYAKVLIDTDKQLQSALVELLGREILENDIINRPQMASIIFQDSSLLTETNNLIHPAVARHFKKWYQEHSRAPYVLREAAILFESGSYQDCDSIVVVSAPEELRISRVMARNDISRKKVLERIANQWTEEQRLARADFIIYNDQSQSLIKQVLRIHEDIIRKADT